MRHKREIQMSKENENRKNLRSRHFLTRLMASFGIMLILPVFLAVVNYLWSRNVLEKETIRYNQAMLDQAQAVIDEKLQGIQLYAFELSQNDSLNSFLRENQMEQGELLVEVELRLLQEVQQVPKVEVELHLLVVLEEEQEILPLEVAVVEVQVRRFRALSSRICGRSTPSHRHRADSNRLLLNARRG